MLCIIRCIKALDKDVIVIIGCDLIKIVGEKQWFLKKFKNLKSDIFSHKPIEVQLRQIFVGIWGKVDKEAEYPKQKKKFRGEQQRWKGVCICVSMICEMTGSDRNTNDSSNERLVVAEIYSERILKIG